MPDLAYQKVYAMNPAEARKRLAQTYQETGSIPLPDRLGEEFGGEDPEHVQALEECLLRPLDGALCRYPKGRKQYNGRVEHSHRADDDEFYRPYSLQIQNTAQMRGLGALGLLLPRGASPLQPGHGGPPALGGSVPVGG